MVIKGDTRSLDNGSFGVGRPGLWEKLVSLELEDRAWG